MGEGSGVRLLFLLASLFLASCSRESALPEGGALEIRLSGDIGSLTASAATRGVINDDHAQTLAVSFARIDQSEDGGWPAYTTVSEPLAATRAAGSGQQNIGFTRAQFYQTRQDNNATKLIGWYPADAAYTQAEGKVTFDISSGTTDVMLTEEVEGNKEAAQQFGASGKTFTFNHLLTQVTVKAFASVDETASKWGKVTSIKVKGQPTQCIVTLPGQTPTWGSATQNLPLKNPADDTDMGQIDLSGKTASSSAATCGYAMFKPTADENLTLEVTTELGGTRDITVTLPDAASPRLFAAGTAYTVTLEFKSTKVEPTASIGAWTPSGSNPSVDL